MTSSGKPNQSKRWETEAEAPLSDPHRPKISPSLWISSSHVFTANSPKWVGLFPCIGREQVVDARLRANQPFCRYVGLFYILVLFIFYFSIYTLIFLPKAPLSLRFCTLVHQLIWYNILNIHFTNPINSLTLDKTYPYKNNKTSNTDLIATYQSMLIDRIKNNFCNI